MKRIPMLAAFVFAATAGAADSPAVPPPQMAGQAFDLLAARVDGLTGEQKARIRAILQEAVRQAQALQGDPPLAHPARRQRMEALIQATAGRIRDALNPDQQPQFDFLVRSMGRK